MMRATPILAALPVALMGVMLWLSATILTPHAGSLAAFDTRVLGYTLADAQAYLTALDDTGRAVYLVELRVLDTLFPITFALLLGHLTLGAAHWMHPWSRMILVLPAAAYALMDLCENALVAGLIRAGADGVNADMVNLASEFTITKWVLVLISVALLGVLWLLRRKPQQA
ncbi:MAG: hypothetical protein ACRBB0_17755 [Pelagimonas sp.]|uniref:hypothetical protein n=1 Tax=Pelagimonas sp. TaxID=2073170 RepID=UPI003D6C0264